MTFSCRLLAVLFLGCCVLSLGCRPQVARLSTLEQGETGRIGFPARDVEGFADLFSEDRELDATGVGTLLLPSSASSQNPVAVMVILHGSGGEWSGRGEAQARFLAEHGIGAFVVDTFTGRGLVRQDKYIQRLMQVNMPDQLADAFAALAILRTHPCIDKNRIGVMGYSMGGLSAILAASAPVADASSLDGARFALHVPMYASCIIQPEDHATTGAPVVALWGEEDRATPRLRCEELVAALREGGSLVEETWYPGAAHGWNSMQELTFHEDLPNFAPCRYSLGPDGSVYDHVSAMTITTDRDLISSSEQCVSFGYSLGRHEETLAKSNQALLEAIQKYMPGDR